MASLTYPLTATATGSLMLTPAEDLDALVVQAITSAVLTKTEERVMMPAYGTPDYTFDAVSSPDILAGYDRAIKDAVKHFGSKVGVTVFGAVTEDGLALRVRYVTPTANDFLRFAATVGYV